MYLRRATGLINDEAYEERLPIHPIASSSLHTTPACALGPRWNNSRAGYKVAGFVCDNRSNVLNVPSPYHEAARNMDAFLRPDL